MQVIHIQQLTNLPFTDRICSSNLTTISGSRRKVFQISISQCNSLENRELNESHSL